MVNDGPKLNGLKRRLMIKKVAERVAELRSDERLLHQQLEPEVETVLKDKNLLVWQELMKQTGFDDESLFEELTQGFRLCGQARASGAFPLGHRPAQQPIEELKKQAEWHRASAVGKCKPFDGGELDQVTWDKAIQERDRGWISGPYTLQDMDKMMAGQPWIVARRFPFQQKDRVRLCDDCLSSGLNSAFSSANKLRLMAVDTLVSLFFCISRCMVNGTGMRLALSDGTVHEYFSFRALGWRLWFGGPNAGPEDRWCRSIVVWNAVEKKPAFFLTSALLFGSTAGVSAFNRLSKSFWHLQTCLLSIMGTVYYYDFPTLEFQATSTSARECSESLLKLLGWQFTEAGRIALPFDKVFTVLGVNVDFSQSRGGRVLIGNKPERVQSLIATVGNVCNKGRVERGEAASLHGQLNFAQGHYIGSELKPVMSLFSSIADEGWHDPRREELTIAAAYMLQVLSYAAPKLVDIGDNPRPVLFFLDGCNDRSGGWSSCCPSGG